MEIKPVLPALSEHQDGTAEAGKEIVRKAILPFCSLHHGHFKDIEMAYSATSGDDIEGTVQLVACDPPYNIIYERGRNNGKHDPLSQDDMDEFVDGMNSVLMKGAHGRI